MTATPLWEVDHAYYCEKTGEMPHYKTWSEFISDCGKDDLDYNLLFRWDWHEGEEETSNFNGDVNYRNGVVSLYFMGQRKGSYRWLTVEVCRADEPAVREYLKPRMEYLMRLWAPMIVFAPEPNA